MSQEVKEGKVAAVSKMSSSSRDYRLDDPAFAGRIHVFTNDGVAVELNKAKEEKVKELAEALGEEQIDQRHLFMLAVSTTNTTLLFT